MKTRGIPKHCEANLLPTTAKRYRPGAAQMTEQNVSVKV